MILFPQSALGTATQWVADAWIGTGPLVSLDVPIVIVSAALLSPFPTALDTAAGADNSTASILGAIARQGWHYNLANNICQGLDTHPSLSRVP